MQQRLQKRMISVINRAQRAKITANELEKLQGVQLLLGMGSSNIKPSSGVPNWFIKGGGIFLFFSISLFFLYQNYFSSSTCYFRLPDEIQKIFRKPENCDFCRNITEMERVENIDLDQFEQFYAYTARPVLVTDGTRGWTAVETFDFAFFKNLYLNLAPNQDNCQFFPYKTEFRSLREALNMSDERFANPWYFGWSSCDPTATHLLRQHYSAPYFLPLTSQRTNLDWIFMGWQGQGAHLHVDNVGHTSWQAQLKGKKKWRLAPPPECYYVCKEFDVVVNPGEIIVIDTDKWYHQTFVVSKDISITIGSEFD